MASVALALMFFAIATAVLADAKVREKKRLVRYAMFRDGHSYADVLNVTPHSSVARVIGASDEAVNMGALAGLQMQMRNAALRRGLGMSGQGASEIERELDARANEAIFRSWR